MMEELKAAQKPPLSQSPNSPMSTAAQTTPPRPPQREPPQPPAPPEQPASKKRSLESSTDQSHNSECFKMRLVLKDLRPHFIEVLGTPDFQNCKAANEIKEKMKLLVELYKQTTTETVSMGKYNNAPGSQPLLGESILKQKPEEQTQVLKPAVSSENKTFRSSSLFEKQQSQDGEAPGTYIVGGSAFGWNFVTFTGNKPVYYGVTKESFRSTQAQASLVE